MHRGRTLEINHPKHPHPTRQRLCAQGEKAMFIYFFTISLPYSENCFVENSAASLENMDYFCNPTARS